MFNTKNNSDDEDLDDEIIKLNTTSVWRDFTECLCESDEENCTKIGCATIGSKLNINDYVEYCIPISKYVAGKDWYGKIHYGYNFEFKLLNNDSI